LRRVGRAGVGCAGCVHDSCNEPDLSVAGERRSDGNDARDRPDEIALADRLLESDAINRSGHDRLVRGPHGGESFRRRTERVLVRGELDDFLSLCTQLASGLFDRFSGLVDRQVAQLWIGQVPDG